MRRLFRIGVIALVFITAPTLARADTAGQSVVFNVNPTYDAQGATSILATLRAVGTHGYFYVDDRVWSALTPTQQSQFQTSVSILAQEFDAVIWPKATTFWGPPAMSINGDPHITVLLEKLGQGNGGYFESKNHYAPQVVSGSNEREMVTVSADSLLIGYTKDFLAHEFQHLISFNQKELLQNVSDDTWLNEARSEYDITVAGYSVPFTGSTLERRAQSFMRTPSDSLTEWPNTSTDYAIASMFVHYLADRFGGTLPQATIHTASAGVVSIQSWLTANSPGTSFADMFTDWMIADELNDRSVDPRYGYSTAGLSSLHVPVQYTAQLGQSNTANWNFAVKEWQPVWLEIDAPAYGTLPPTLSVGVTGASAVPWGGAYIADYGGTKKLARWSTQSGTATLAVPSQQDGRSLRSVVLMLTQGTLAIVDDRTIVAQPVSVMATFGALVVPTPLPTPLPLAATLRDGDLIDHSGQPEVYVIWGPYRRYLTSGILALYGFQDRPIIPVPDDVFVGYRTSNYIRAVDQQKVYAVWPDGTKHWLNITPAQWDASGRDWNAIFIVNDAEVNFYRTGPDITQ